MKPDFVVARILKELNAESGRNIRDFLAGRTTEQQLKEQSFQIKVKYYDALVEKGVITASEEARRQIVELGKAMPISVDAALKCKAGEITWSELVNICSSRVLPIARQEAENARKV
jgi:hypothetical protein